jgi:hypothetical protein
MNIKTVLYLYKYGKHATLKNSANNQLFTGFLLFDSYQILIVGSRAPEASHQK